MISEGSCDTEDWSNDAENQLSVIYFYIFIKCNLGENKILSKTFFFKSIRHQIGKQKRTSNIDP